MKRRKSSEAVEVPMNFLKAREPDVMYPLPLRRSALVPMRGVTDAILFWTFDEPGGAAHQEDAVLVARLSADEAMAILEDRGGKSGLLEVIRASITHRIAFVSGYDGDVTPFLISRKQSESEFFAELYAAAEDPQRYCERLVKEAEAGVEGFYLPPRFDIGDVMQSFRPLAATLPQRA